LRFPQFEVASGKIHGAYAAVAHFPLLIMLTISLLCLFAFFAGLIDAAVGEAD
jgi:hypothetical protein